VRNGELAKKGTKFHWH